MEIPGYSEPDKYVPEIDKNYHFDEETTLAILAGFKYNRRVLSSRFTWYWKIYSY